MPARRGCWDPDPYEPALEGPGLPHAGRGLPRRLGPARAADQPPRRDTGRAGLHRGAGLEATLRGEACAAELPVLLEAEAGPDALEQLRGDEAHAVRGAALGGAGLRPRALAHRDGLRDWANCRSCRRGWSRTWRAVRALHRRARRGCERTARWATVRDAGPAAHRPRGAAPPAATPRRACSRPTRRRQTFHVLGVDGETIEEERGASCAQREVLGLQATPQDLAVLPADGAQSPCGVGLARRGGFRLGLAGGTAGGPRSAVRVSVRARRGPARAARPRRAGQQRAEVGQRGIGLAQRLLDRRGRAGPGCRRAARRGTRSAAAGPRRLAGLVVGLRPPASQARGARRGGQVRSGPRATGPSRPSRRAGRRPGRAGAGARRAAAGWRRCPRAGAAACAPCRPGRPRGAARAAGRWRGQRPRRARAAGSCR